MSGSKNLGQVAGVHISNTPPENIKMIWYDNTPSQMVHKVYDVNLSQWVVLDKNTISTITYSELVNLATSVGLSVGAWFKISDRSNALALAVTTTKVQYSDSLGNVLIDDLGTNIQYHVTSSNLSIDDVIGVFDNVNKKLVFQFNEHAPDYSADDFVLGKIQRNGVWSLAKYKLSSFLSKVTGNSITWNGGFFFNFASAISNILDKSGGVVSKSTYDNGISNLTSAINNVAQENQNIIQNANQAISDSTTSQAIYDKTLTNDLAIGGAATNLAKGDTLYTLMSKIQRWINQFKIATGIRLSTAFTQSMTKQFINNNDTVETALAKIQYWLKMKLDKESSGILLNSEFVPSENDIVPGETDLTGVLERIFFDLEEIVTDSQTSFEEITLRKRYDKIINNVDDLININSFSTASSFLIRKGTYNITSNDSEVINVSSIIQNNKIVEFEPGVVINIFNNTESDQIIFFGTEDIEFVNHILKGRWNGNGAVINVNGVERVRVFYKVYNISNFVLNSIEGAKPGFYVCNGLSMCHVNSATTSFQSCYNLSRCSGRFIGCEYSSNCRGYFNSCFQCFQCIGTKGSSVNTMIDGTPFSNTAAGGFNNLTSE